MRFNRTGCVLIQSRDASHVPNRSQSHLNHYYNHPIIPSTVYQLQPTHYHHFPLAGLFFCGILSPRMCVFRWNFFLSWRNRKLWWSDTQILSAPEMCAIIFSIQTAQGRCIWFWVLTVLRECGELKNNSKELIAEWRSDNVEVYDTLVIMKIRVLWRYRE